MDEEEKKPKQPSFHRPEFIIIEDERIEQVIEEEETTQNTYYESLHKLHVIKPTAAVRIACLISSFMIYIYTAFIGVLLLITLFLTILTLGYSKRAVKALVSFWHLFLRLFVIGSGLFVGLFSPTFGLGIIILFFVLRGGKEDPILSRIFKSKFYTNSN